MSINLDLFCSTDFLRKDLARPISQGEITFATNGHIAVRVPKVPSIRARRKPDVAATFTAHFDSRARFRGLPFVAIESTTCPVCADVEKGEGPIICEWCHSTGVVFASVWVGPRCSMAAISR